MRIAIVNEQWTAGATRCARDLQRGLRASHTVEYFPESGKLTPSEQMAELKRFRPDIVHLHSYYGDLPYSFLGEVGRRFATVFTPHDPRPIGSTMLACWNCDEYSTCFRCPMVGRLRRYSLLRHDYFRQRIAKRRVHAGLPGNTTVVCVSDWMRERILRTELARLRVERIHNGINLELFRRDPDARKALGISPNARVITFVAHHSGWTMDERKGGHVLARALAEIVIPRFPDVIILAVGGGMIPNLPNIRPIGFVKPAELTQYYSAADVFVAPSLADNLPYTVLEAMACEVPVVASRVGGIPEEVNDRETGRLFAAGSWQGLGECLLEILENPTRSALMGTAARKRVEDHFSLRGFVKEYEALFASLGD